MHYVLLRSRSRSRSRCGCNRCRSRLHVSAKANCRRSINVNTQSKHLNCEFVPSAQYLMRDAVDGDRDKKQRPINTDFRSVFECVTRAEWERVLSVCLNATTNEITFDLLPHSIDGVFLTKSTKKKNENRTRVNGGCNNGSRSSSSSHQNNESTGTTERRFTFRVENVTIVDNRWSDGRRRSTGAQRIKKELCCGRDGRCCRCCCRDRSCSHAFITAIILYYCRFIIQLCTSGTFRLSAHKKQTQTHKPFKMNQNKNVWRFAVSVSQLPYHSFRCMHRKMIYIIHNE